MLWAVVFHFVVAISADWDPQAHTTMWLRIEQDEPVAKRLDILGGSWSFVGHEYGSNMEAKLTSLPKAPRKRNVKAALLSVLGNAVEQEGAQTSACCYLAKNAFLK